MGGERKRVPKADPGLTFRRSRVAGIRPGDQAQRLFHYGSEDVYMDLIPSYGQKTVLSQIGNRGEKVGRDPDDYAARA